MTLVEKVKKITLNSKRGVTYEQVAKKLGCDSKVASEGSVGRAMRNLRKQGLLTSEKIKGRLTFFPSSEAPKPTTKEGIKKTLKAKVEKKVASKKTVKKTVPKAEKVVVIKKSKPKAEKVNLGINPNLKRDKAYIDALEKAIASNKDSYSPRTLLAEIRRNITTFLKNNY